MTLQTYQGKTMTDFDMKSYHFYITEVNHLYISIEAHSEEEARKEFELHRKDADQMRDDLEDHCYFEILESEPFKIENVEEGIIP